MLCRAPQLLCNVFNYNYQGVIHLHASKSGLAAREFGRLERVSNGTIERSVAAFNFGIASATAGELKEAEAAFTRALEALAVMPALDREKVSIPRLELRNPFFAFAPTSEFLKDEM